MAALVLTFREGVAVEGGGGHGLCVQGPGARVVLRRISPAVSSALRRLAPPGDGEEWIADGVLGEEGPGALASWYFTLQRLARRGLVTRSVEADGRRLATLLPTSPEFMFEAIAPAVPDQPYLLSRFAYLRREGNALVLESPLAHSRIELVDGGTVGLIGALATPGTARELAERAGVLPVDAVTLLLGLCASARMVEPVQPDGPGADHEPPALRCWEFPDLLFHARSRKGRSDAPFGSTYRMAGRVEPPPAVKPEGAGDTIALARPDLGRLERDDPPLAQVMESRRSHRDYGPRPVTIGQLGEFLYRVARVKEVREVEVETPRGPVRMEFAPRPYPSGGGLYELELYLAVHACDGLDPGLYRYEPRHHRLGRVGGRADETAELVSDAAASAGIPAERVQVLIILAARLPRLSWKYASIAYALTLKHVGVLYQTMYLAATAMRLAPCALGGGDSDLFARAAGTDYYAETSVGEFLLGSRAPEVIAAR